MKEIRIKAPAKINLYLHITGKKENGYHLIDSLFAFSNICDEIHIKQSSSIELDIKGPFAQKLLPEKENNLVIKAANKLYKASNVNKGAKITLIKNLPIASGVGGGSSDAAACIKALVKFWNLNIKEEQLYNLAYELGADVPSCLYTKPCFVSGIGEIIKPAGQIPDFGILLINPLVEVSTPEVFKQRKNVFSKPMSFNTKNINHFEFIKKLKQRKNDLFEPAQKLNPQINKVINNINSTKDCLFAQMSGSGATCFGLYENEKKAKEACQKLKGEMPNFWIKSGSLTDKI